MPVNTNSRGESEKARLLAFTRDASGTSTFSVFDLRFIDGRPFVSYQYATADSELPPILEELDLHALTPLTPEHWLGAEFLYERSLVPPPNTKLFTVAHI